MSEWEKEPGQGLRYGKWYYNYTSFTPEFTGLNSEIRHNQSEIRRPRKNKGNVELDLYLFLELDWRFHQQNVTWYGRLCSLIKTVPWSFNTLFVISHTLWNPLVNFCRVILHFLNVCISSCIFQSLSRFLSDYLGVFFAGGRGPKRG